MASESKMENPNTINLSKSLGSVVEFAKELELRANDMETHGWSKEAADLRKWAVELRSSLAKHSLPNV